MLAKIKSSLVKYITFGLSLTLMANFFVSLCIWIVDVWYISTTDRQFSCPYFLHAASTLVLFLISLAAFILVTLKKRKAVFLLLFTVILSICCFAYETHYAKWFYRVYPIMVNGPEPYQGIGYRHLFVNWWWYEKDIIRSGDFTTNKVFHHFFGIRAKGYISSSTLMYIGDEQKDK